MTGIVAATIGALESLLSVGGTHPWWSLAIFALCVWILYGLIVFGEDQPAATYVWRLENTYCVLSKKCALLTAPMRHQCRK